VEIEQDPRAGHEALRVDLREHAADEMARAPPRDEAASLNRRVVVHRDWAQVRVHRHRVVVTVEEKVGAADFQPRDLQRRHALDATMSGWCGTAASMGSSAARAASKSFMVAPRR